MRWWAVASVQLLALTGAVLANIENERSVMRELRELRHQLAAKHWGPPQREHEPTYPWNHAGAETPVMVEKQPFFEPMRVTLGERLAYHGTLRLYGGLKTLVSVPLQLLYKITAPVVYSLMRAVMYVWAYTYVLNAPAVYVAQALYTGLVVWPLHALTATSRIFYHVYLVVGVACISGTFVGMLGVLFLSAEHLLYAARGRRAVAMY